MGTKTIKYVIASYLSDGIVTAKVEVSKTKFQQVLKETLKQYNSQNSSDEFYVELDSEFQVYQTYIEKRTSFTFGISYIDFVVLECREGYYFTK